MKHEELQSELKQSKNRLSDVSERLQEQDQEVKRLQKNRADLKEEVLEMTTNLSTADTKPSENETKFMEKELETKKLQEANTTLEQELN